MDSQPYAGVIQDLYQDVSGDESARKQAKAVPELAFWYFGEVSTWAAARLMHLPRVPLAVLLSAVDRAEAARESPARAQA